MLTDAQELQINSVERYTHDYEAEAMKSYDATGDDLCEELSERFRDVLEFDVAEDLGGLVVYFVGEKLVAFYDYENFKGAVFEVLEEEAYEQMRREEDAGIGEDR